MLVTQSCLTLCDPMDCSPPGSSVHRIRQGRIMEWVAIPFSKGSSRPRDQTQVFYHQGSPVILWCKNGVLYIYVYTHTHIYICMCVNVCVCIFDVYHWFLSQSSLEFPEGESIICHSNELLSTLPEFILMRWLTVEDHRELPNKDESPERPNTVIHPTPISGEEREAGDWIITTLEQRDSDSFWVGEHTDRP